MFKITTYLKNGVIHKSYCNTEGQSADLINTAFQNGVTHQEGHGLMCYPPTAIDKIFVEEVNFE